MVLTCLLAHSVGSVVQEHMARACGEPLHSAPLCNSLALGSNPCWDVVRLCRSTGIETGILLASGAIIKTEILQQGEKRLESARGSRFQAVTEGKSRQQEHETVGHISHVGHSLEQRE